MTLNQTLPEVPLAEIATPISRNIEVIPGRRYRTIGVKWWGEGAYERQTIDGSRTAAKTLSLVRQGDLIINKIWVRHGSTAIAGADVDGCAASGEFPTFALNEGRVEPRWLHWQTKTRGFWAKCDALSQGTSGKNRIKPELFLTIRVPLPPLDEQRRLVARIEVLAAQLHEARTLRQEAADETQAFAGASASRLFQESRKQQPIETIAEVRGGIQKGPHRTPGANPVRYLTVAHVQRNRILTDSPRYFEVSPEELQRWRLRRGDVLIIEGNGSADQIGRTALFRGEIENCVHQNHVIRIRPDQEQMSPEFLNAFLNSPAGQEAVQAQSRTSSGLRSLSVGRIKSIAVPVPPLADQRRVVAELDALQVEVEALKRLQAETAAELEALLPSILDRAFAGALL
jgi:type I restriction enzyme S subunit